MVTAIATATAAATTATMAAAAAAMIGEGSSGCLTEDDTAGRWWICGGSRQGGDREEKGRV